MLPPRTDPRWRRLVDDPAGNSYQFLALRILMQRVQRNRTKSDFEPEAMVDEVYSLFQKHGPLMAADIETLFT